ncbi:3-deoxy-D-manno-octulosonate 8-phosphate phosphatase [uncultured Candidatus Thioglobus sp.]|nr:3-deoxy-D-manno-octulosonate 8-phosphate phosphatase [uncultured Candidatus Thioglobus sp.]
MSIKLDVAVLAKAKQIKLAIFDVDGVLTDGSLLLGANGDEYKAVHAHDGMGLVMLRQSGCHVAIISGRSSRAFAQHMSNLGVEHVHQGVRDKVKVFKKLLVQLSLTEKEAAYVGDDFIDLPVMRCVGLACAVADAHPLVIEHAHWITKNNGGRGAVREICELIMRAKGTFDSQLQKFLVE